MKQWLIDANAIFDKVKANYMMSEGVQHVCEREFLKLLCNAPTVDAVPVRHGYNKQFEFPSQFTCSVCCWESWDTYCGDTDTFNYCPNCGAKMDGTNGERKKDE